MFPFQCVRALEMIDYLAENCKMRFKRFRSDDTNIRVCWNPFSFDVSYALEKLQLVFIELLQYDSNLRSDLNQEALIIFYCLFTNISVFCYVS
jgi:hypothetical protein